MKKIRIMLLVICLFTLNLNFCIVKANEKEQRIAADRDVVLVINNQLSQEERTILFNQGNYCATMADMNLEKNAILRKYDVSYWTYSHLPLQEFLEKINSLPEALCKNYWIFAESPFLVQTFKQNEKISVNRDQTNGSIPKYITDIQNMGATEVFNNKKCQVEGIYCFDASSSQLGTIVYIDTNNGSYVKYYESLTSEAVLLTEAEFQKYGKAYYDYISSDEYNYSISGEGKGGGNQKFSDFVLSYNKQIEKRDKTLITLSSILLIIVTTITVWHVKKTYKR